ncbi:Putative FAD-dependent pyridine nucleotide-disulfide oxidoreductase [Magnetospirillum sp. XM-1]|uniref:hypothetical protein n=1 Tax=Magnetospirillum sp. XM-1 TaxID=1663591 RepID=UPI00073DD2CD|nr:hypothetical protein [Magnetospirillum sp. XM-1]CUW38069.1 Putative FAD-dependent pyridine nucleotide-disulfide oxidoreductase [Magnetospirillum sp. XM-1]
MTPGAGPSPRIAVIGSGAAAAGALLGVERSFPDAEVWLFERREPPEFPPFPPPSADPDFDYQRRLARLTRRRYGLAFPPPKTHFGVKCPGIEVSGWGRLWESRERGGLTRHWGGVTARFGPAELRRWPVEAAELAPFYDRAAEEMGVCSPDAGSSRPPIRPIPAVRDLMATLAGTEGGGGGLTLTPNLPAMALETRPGEARRCTYTGGCMAGCPRDSVYSAARTIDRMVAGGVVSKVVPARVLAMDLATRTLALEEGEAGPFDLILVAAGCLGTGQILLRSLPGLEYLDLLDNPVFTFPILAHGGTSERGEGYFGLTNACITVTPADPALPAATVQVYPAMDHLWQSLVPGILWPLAAPFGRLLRRHVLIGRLYLHSDHGSVVRMQSAADGSLRLSLGQAGGLPEGLWPALRRAFHLKGFRVPNLPPLRQKTSSHYAGTLPYGTHGLGADGCLRPGIHLCDATVFPDGPAASPTLTIMANAMRTAMAAQPAP